MGLKLITPPATTPVTLAEAKAHLRVDFTDDDAQITAFIQAATGTAEAYLGRALVDQTWDLYLDSFPTGTDKEIQIPKPPLISVVSVTYDDTGGIAQTIDPATYYVDGVSEPGWLVPAGTANWPTPIAAINSVRVRFRAGYLSNDSPPSEAVPRDIKAAILLTVGTLYEQREGIAIGRISIDQLPMGPVLPWGADQLLRNHRVWLGMA